MLRMDILHLNMPQASCTSKKKLNKKNMSMYCPVISHVYGKLPVQIKKYLVKILIVHSVKWPRKKIADANRHLQEYTPNLPVPSPGQPHWNPRRFCRATFTAPSGPEGNDAQNQPKKAGEKFGIGNTSSERVSLPVLDGRFLLKKMVGILTLSGMDILSFFSWTTSGPWGLHLQTPQGRFSAVAIEFITRRWDARAFSIE